MTNKDQKIVALFDNKSITHTNGVCAKDLMNIDPIRVLLTIHSAQGCETLEQKVKVLHNIVKDIEQCEDIVDKDQALTTWGSIASVFLSCGAVAGLSSLNPLIGAGLVATSVIGTAATIGSSLLLHRKNESLAEKIQKLRLALTEHDLLNWACVWGLAGADLFVDCLQEASKGDVIDNRILHKTNKDTPLTAAVKIIARHQCVDFDTTDARLKEIKDGTRQQMEARLETSAKTIIENSRSVLQSQNIPALSAIVPVVESSAVMVNDIALLNNNAIAIRDSLVTRAADSVMGGCIILAAPGAGKTTFLGTAWGHLKQRHGGKFKSLAVVVKTSDVDAFKGVSDEAVSVKHGAVSAAKKIINFINSSTVHTGNISRLFLDDFLTMIKYLGDALKGKFIDPMSGDIFHNRKDASEVSEDFVPLYDHLLTLLNEYWLVGREFNSALWVSSHSSNVEDLPFMGSATARSVGDMIFLAKNGKREFLELALNNTYLINDSAKRLLLKQQLDTISISSEEPLILANFNNWTLGVVPSSLHEEYQSFRKQWQQTKLIQDSATTRILEEKPELFTETTLQSVEETLQEKTVFDNENRDNDFGFITAAANIAKNHILQNEWTEFDLEKLRKVNKFKSLSSTNKPLTVTELKAVVSILTFSGFLIETSKDNFKVVSLLD